MRIPPRPTSGPARCDQRRRGRRRAGRVRAHAALVRGRAERRAEDRRLGHAVARSSATIRPPRITSDPVGEPQDLLDLARDEQDRHPVGGEPTSSS